MFSSGLRSALGGRDKKPEVPIAGPLTASEGSGYRASPGDQLSRIAVWPTVIIAAVRSVGASGQRLFHARNSVERRSSNRMYAIRARTARIGVGTRRVRTRPPRVHERTQCVRRRDIGACHACAVRIARIDRAARPCRAPRRARRAVWRGVEPSRTLRLASRLLAIRWSPREREELELVVP